MTVRTRAQLNSDADTNLADNTAGDISASDVRASVKDLADSAWLAEHTLTPPGLIYGLTLSNNVTDATNDIDIAIGSAASDDTVPVPMTLSGALTKRLDAAWAVGTNQGGRMSAAAIADTTYHMWLIRRSDTGVVDVGFDTSATAPTMPANYDQKRRIGSIIRASAAIVVFKQFGDYFYRTSLITEYSSTSSRASALLTVSTPAGIKTQPLISGELEGDNTAARSIYMKVGGADSGASLLTLAAVGDAAYMKTGSSTESVETNTSSQIYMAVTISSGTILAGRLLSAGWIDTRGRLG